MWPPSSGLAQVPAGGEFRVNSYTVGSQTVPDMGADASGAFVVAWSGQYGSLHRVFAQRFDASGAPRGAEFQVSAATTSFINFGAIAVSRRGAFLAAWSASSPGELGDIAARTFDASGNPRGPQFAVNTYTTGAQRYASVAALPGARYVVVWEHWPEGTPFAADVGGQLFDADGNALTRSSRSTNTPRWRRGSPASQPPTTAASSSSGRATAPPGSASSGNGSMPPARAWVWNSRSMRPPRSGPLPA